MRAANLLASDMRPARRVRLPRSRLPLVGAAGLLVLVAAFVAWASIAASGDVSRSRAELAAVQAELAGVPPPKPQPGSALAGELAARTDALSLALSRRIAWDRVLRQFAFVLPSDVWLTSLSLRSPFPSTAPAPASGGAAPSTAAAGSGVAISGYTYSQAGVARMLARVAAVPYFANVQLQSSAATKLPSGQPIVSFTIAAVVRPPAEAAS